MRTNIPLFLCDDDIASTPPDLEARLLEDQQKDPDWPVRPHH
jgi:hypothetical protein